MELFRLLYLLVTIFVCGYNNEPKPPLKSLPHITETFQISICKPTKWHSQHTDRTYIISKKAEIILSTVLADMLEESLQNARSLAVIAGKSSVSRKDMERSLRNLCLRLSTEPAYKDRLGSWNEVDEATSKVVSDGCQRRCGVPHCQGDCRQKIITIYRNLRFIR